MIGSRLANRIAFDARRHCSISFPAVLRSRPIQHLQRMTMTHAANPSNSSKEPENELEKSLQLAFQNPSQRLAFIQKLMEEAVYFLGVEDDQGEMKEMHTWQLPIKGTDPPDTRTWIPIWPAVSRIHETSFPSDSTLDNVSVYPVRTGRYFFERTKGAHVLLCSGGLGLNKEFLPQEIEQMLDGSLGKPSTHTLEAGTKVYVGAPANWPTQAVASLSDYMAQNVQGTAPVLVEKAWLGWWITSETKEEGNYVMGLQVSSTTNPGDVQQLLRNITHIIESGHPGVVMDIALWSREEPPNAFLQGLVAEQDPFFDTDSI